MTLLQMKILKQRYYWPAPLQRIRCEMLSVATSQFEALLWFGVYIPVAF